MIGPPDNPDPNQNPESPDPWLPPGTARWFWAALAVSGAIIAVQLIPYSLEHGYFGRPRGPFLGLTYPGHGTMILQLLIFIPLGWIEAELARRVLGGWRIGAWGALLVAVDAGLLALICETIQHWIISRNSSWIDVLAAAVGGVAGYMLSTLWRGHPGDDPTEP